MPSDSSRLHEVVFRAEDDVVFRMAQLLLVLTEIGDDGVAVDRLTYYDYFAANPFLVFEENESQRTKLRLAGFESSAISYLSPSQRFATRQERVSADVGVLVAIGLALRTGDEKALRYAATTIGAETASALASMYAHGYRESVRLILGRLGKLSDKRLHDSARSWLEPDDVDFAGLRWDLSSTDSEEMSVQ